MPNEKEQKQVENAARSLPAGISNCRLLKPDDYRVVADLLGPGTGFAFLILNCAAGELQQLIAEPASAEACYVQAYVVPAYDAGDERVFLRLDVGVGDSRISLAFDAETNRTGLTLLPGCLYLVFSEAPAAVLDTLTGVVVGAAVGAVGGVAHGTAHGEINGREVAPLVDGGKLRQALDDYGGIAALRIERVWRQLAHAVCLAQAAMYVLRDEYVIWCAPEPSGPLH